MAGPGGGLDQKKTLKQTAAATATTMHGRL